MVASIDLGTNTLRLLVARKSSGGLVPLETILTIPRIGENLDRSGIILSKNIERVLKILRQFKKILSSYRCETIYPFATASLRYPSNGRMIQNLIFCSTGFHFEILSGQREGSCSFLGATYLLKNISGPVCVLDIGGGSTELSTGIPGSVPDWTVSLRLGSRSLTERFNLFEFPAQKSLKDAESFILSRLKQCDVSSRHFERLIGVAGTVTTIKCLADNITVYRKPVVHGSVLTYREVTRVFRDYGNMSVRRRLRHPLLPQGRADVIIGGILIVKTLMKHLSLKSITVSDEDILYGRLYETFLRPGVV